MQLTKAAVPTPATPGGGRVFDMASPFQTDHINSNVGIQVGAVASTFGLARNSSALWANVTIHQGTGTKTYQLYQGERTIALNSAGATTNQNSVQVTLGMFPRTTRSSTPVGKGGTDTACWVFRTRVAWVGAAAANDVGVALAWGGGAGSYVTGGGGMVALATSRAVGLMLNAAGTGIVVRIRKSGTGYTDLPVAWPAPITDLVDVEFVVTSATQTKEAELRIYAGGALLWSASWGAGTILPDWADSPTALEIYPVFANMSLGVTTNVLHWAGWRFVAGPDEASTR